MNTTVEIWRPNMPNLLFLDKGRVDSTVTLDVMFDNADDGRCITMYFENLETLIAWLTSDFDQVSKLAGYESDPPAPPRHTHLTLVPRSPGEPTS